MNFYKVITLGVLVLMLTGCKTSGLKSRKTAVKTDVYRVWIEPSYAKSLRKLNGPVVRYQTIKIIRPDPLTLQKRYGEN